MRARASIAGHPIHPMLVPIPIGLWLFSLVCDFVYRFGSGDTVWYTVATYDLVAGLVGALVAAVFGYGDRTALSGEVRRVATRHMIVNLIIVVLYAVNAWLRVVPGPYSDLPFALSIVGVALLGYSGWLGGHMVYEHRAGVSAAGSDDARGTTAAGRRARA